MNTTSVISPATLGAALKREKAAAAKRARLAGKIAAAVRRTEEEKKKAERESIYTQENGCILLQIETARRKLGLNPDEPNPTSVCLLIERLTFEMKMRLTAKGFW